MGGDKAGRTRKVLGGGDEEADGGGVHDQFCDTSFDRLELLAKSCTTDFIVQIMG